ncbi:DUF406 family protein [Shewanella sp. NIFS-20-20]|uniref:DUF406 family protein n=1 Tax=Shewanella sp. NIFS-20-20 TaxID=2853806 RepID=UPI001C476E28|nr:DUF406 family protein [Shewanella sp. NIFS-20-20]MBV7317585.1 YfcZ/YiiS family protein [Shewanella sp. NIFS-20-20]
MKSIREAQSQAVNDTCTDCGSYIDIGSVIDADDNVLQLNVSEERALYLSSSAQERFADVQVNMISDKEEVTLTLTFGISAEKMIFQLQHGL